MKSSSNAVRSIVRPRGLAVIGLGLFCAFSARAENPLLRDWSSTGGIPPFNEIKASDIVPAYERAIAEERAEIRAICEQKSEPDYFNTIRRLTLAGAKIDRIHCYTGNMISADLTPELAKAGEVEAKLLAAREIEIFSNSVLFERVARVYERRAQLNAERRRVAEKIHRRFLLAGAKLEPSRRQRLREIKERINVLRQRFMANHNAECQAFQKEFGFAPIKFRSRIAKTEDRALRERMYRAYTSLGRSGRGHDNLPVAEEMLKLRLEMAKLLGYRNSADLLVEPTMAKTPEKALAMMEMIYAKSREAAARRRPVLEKLAGGGFEPWDWEYYTQKLRERTVNFNSEEIRPYLPREKVFAAVRAIARKMYGIESERVENAPSFAPGRTDAWRFRDADGTLLGTLVYDYHPRPTKHAGAWIDNYVYQYRDADGCEIRPVASQAGSIEGNFTLSNVITVFHEFGHALQAMLSRCEDSTLSGLNGTHEYNEIFSQFNQEIGIDPSVLITFAENEKGEKPSREFLERAFAAHRFGDDVAIGERIATAILDLKLHMLTNLDGVDLEKFERQVRDELGMRPEQHYAYSIPTMRHVFCHGYEAGFFAYAWSRVMSEDLLNEFRRKKDLTDATLALRFRRCFLECGSGRDPMDNFREFMHREPSIEPYLRAVGITAGASGRDAIQAGSCPSLP